MCSQNYLTAAEEHNCYKQHNNDITDIRYQNFVRPIVDRVLADFLPTDLGLDFGAGSGPVISKMLSDALYSIKQYDPFFHNYPEVLQQTYNYIVCCEVVEHFHNPYKEFSLLYHMLKETGKLYCKTVLYSDDIDFPSWHYRNDKTHVFFYQKETMRYIQKHFHFSNLEFCDAHCVVFTK